MDNDGDASIDEGFPDSDGDGIIDAIDNCTFTPNPKQIDMDLNHLGDACARQLTDEFEGPLLGCRYLVMVRDTKFTKEFKAILKREGVEPVLCPPRAPNWNPFAEQFVRSAKEECLSRIRPFGAAPVRHAVGEFAAHYHFERNHQGLDNRLVETPSSTRHTRGPVHRRERLGGMLSYYHREAA